jgi:hypothetical protein
LSNACLLAGILNFEGMFILTFPKHPGSDSIVAR